MLVSIITFLSSSAGGAVVGILQGILAQKREDKAQKRERRHQRELSNQAHGALMYSKAMQAAKIKPTRYVYERKVTRFKHCLWVIRWGEPINTVVRVSEDKLSQTPREKTSAFTIVMIMATYCICCLWVGFWIFSDFTTIPIDAKQAGFSVLGIFKVQWGGNKPIEQSGLSTLVYMLSPLVFIASHWIIRKGAKS